MSYPNRPDSVVLETITGRGSVYSVIHRQEMIRRVDGLISENNMNLGLINSIYEAIYQNKSKSFFSRLGRIVGRDSVNVVLTRLNSSALGLLLAEHYLEENDEFYTFVSSLSILINSINSHLDNWSYENAKNVENWFQEREVFSREVFQMYRQQLSETRKKLIDLI